jgi:hypothetical protein
LGGTMKPESIMKFKAILVNAKARTVTNVEIDDDKDHLQQYYSFIGCDLVTVVNLENGDTMWLDDEGLLKDPKDFFLIRDYPEPLAGNALITGTRWDDEGDHLADTKSTVETIKATIQFMDRNTVGLWAQLNRAKRGGR